MVHCQLLQWWWWWHGWLMLVTTRSMCPWYLVEGCGNRDLQHPVTVYCTENTLPFWRLLLSFLFSDNLTVQLMLFEACPVSVTLYVDYRLMSRRLLLTKLVLQWNDAWSLWTRTEICLWLKFVFTARHARLSNSVSFITIIIIVPLSHCPALSLSCSCCCMFLRKL